MIFPSPLHDFIASGFKVRSRRRGGEIIWTSCVGPPKLPACSEEAPMTTFSFRYSSAWRTYFYEAFALSRLHCHRSHPPHYDPAPRVDLALFALFAVHSFYRLLLTQSAIISTATQQRSHSGEYLQTLRLAHHTHEQPGYSTRELERDFRAVSLIQGHCQAPPICRNFGVGQK